MSKRNIPVPVQNVLKLDKTLTDTICKLSEKYHLSYPIQKNKNFLEYSCNGVVWISIWILFVWVLWSKSLFQMQINFLFGLLIDICAVAVIKALTRRRRPAGHKSEDIFEVGPDKFSFPSGHAARATFIFHFFTSLYPLSYFPSVALSIWALLILFSRIVLRRHYLLDVLAGSLLGLLESYFISFIWISQKFSFYIVETLTDERFEGAEYDV